ncbi:MAG: N-acetylglucosamine-6-phosphate deacetylase [Kastovskya adunca ATA6-11-RM4]|jgi:N-acetylglucosamine-6-phosphate deacetylase|nr:N-acetylglucosamine-6-phosphate deacetylase [Kastovskya adunca ATA6-11-RM4]
MTPNLDIIKARLPGYRDLQHLRIREGAIAAITPMSEWVQLNDPPQPPFKEGEEEFTGVTTESFSPSPQLLDLAGDWLSLGGVDLQINGGLGLAFTDLDATHRDKLPEIGQFLWNQGVDGYLPTLVTTSVEKIGRSLRVFAEFLNHRGKEVEPKAVAQILGVHLEGPFLNPDKRGAHPAEFLLPLTIENVKRVLGDYAHVVKVMTLAPELDTTGEVIPYLRSLGITISLGHSLASATQAEASFRLGASMVTHAFNAMPGLHHREPGLLGAALVYPGVQCGLIADGQHVSPAMMQLLLRASGYEEGIFLVSDALAPIGLPDGVYPWDSRQIEVKHGTARLPDGTLSGTTLPLLVGVQNLVRWGICEAEKAISLATDAPRRAIGLSGLSVGQPAQLLRWHSEASTTELTWQRLSSKS